MVRYLDKDKDKVGKVATYFNLREGGSECLPSQGFFSLYLMGWVFRSLVSR